MALKCSSVIGTHAGIQQLPENNDDAAYRNDELGIYAIADGVTKSPHSAKASRMAVDEAANFLVRCITSRAGEPDDLVRGALLYANEQVYSRLNVQVEGEGTYEIADPAVTTLVVGLVNDHMLHVASVGDSHVYVLGADNQLEQLVDEDRSPVGNLLTRNIGSRKVVEHHYRAYPLRNFRRILFATDGLYKMLTPDELTACLVREARVEDIVNELIQYANAPRQVARLYAEQRGIPFERAQKSLGGCDNVTGILIALSEEPSHAIS